MLGNIIGIEENTVLIQLNPEVVRNQNLVNFHVIMEDPEKKIVGEITDIKDNIGYVNLLGEFDDQNRFVVGVIRKPSFGATIKLISKEKIPLIISTNEYKEDRDLILGESPIYTGVNLSVSVNEFFANHFAVFGNSGSGKSCSVARIIQNLFEKQNAIPYRASFFIFDAYGEYHQAFKELYKKSPNINFKALTTNTNFSESEVIKIPLWLLSVDDIALLLETNSRAQLPIIEKAMKFVTIFAKEEDEVIKNKNDIIARALLDILSRGSSPAQIRDQIFSVLSHYNTKDLNLDTPIYQPGYTRPLKQCLLIDSSGKIREMELLTTFIGEFLLDDVELSLPDGSFKYTLKQLYEAFEFALISEGVLSSGKVFDEYNVLKVLRVKRL